MTIYYQSQKDVSKILDFFKWAIELENVDIKNKSEWISTIESKEQNTKILTDLENKIRNRNKIKVNSVVEYCKSPYTVVNINKEKMLVDIKQN